MRAVVFVDFNMKIFFISLLFLITSQVWSAVEFGVDLPGNKVGNNRYFSTATIDEVIKYIRKKGTTNYTQESFDAPNIYVVHLKNNNSSGKWLGINIYTGEGGTHVYIIPNEK